MYTYVKIHTVTGLKGYQLKFNYQTKRSLFKTPAVVKILKLENMFSWPMIVSMGGAALTILLTLLKWSSQVKYVNLFSSKTKIHIAQSHHHHQEGQARDTHTTQSVKRA